MLIWSERWFWRGRFWWEQAQEGWQGGWWRSFLPDNEDEEDDSSNTPPTPQPSFHASTATVAETIPPSLSTSRSLLMLQQCPFEVGIFGCCCSSIGLRWELFWSCCSSIRLRWRKERGGGGRSFQGGLGGGAKKESCLFFAIQDPTEVMQNQGREGGWLLISKYDEHDDVPELSWVRTEGLPAENWSRAERAGVTALPWGDGDRGWGCSWTKAAH